MSTARIFMNIILGWRQHFGQVLAYSRLSVQNPTCRFDRKSSLSHCSFGKYIVVFGNTVVTGAKINDYSYIQTNGRIFNCSIGKFCSIASGVTIAPGMHNMSMVSTHPALTQKSTPLPKVFAHGNNIIDSQQVKIGNDVWIGEKVVVLDGVCVGNGAVIAAGAVVVKDVEPYSVVGGIPAKHIKYRFDKKTIEILQKSEWWNYSDEWFEQNAELMLDVNKFIEAIKK